MQAETNCETITAHSDMRSRHCTYEYRMDDAHDATLVFKKKETEHIRKGYLFELRRQYQIQIRDWTREVESRASQE